MALGPNIDARQLLAAIKGAPRALRVIAAIAAVDIVILLFATFSLEDDADALIDRVAMLKGQISTQRQTIEATRKEIDRLPELRRQYDAAIGSGVLADQDRLKLVTLAQDLANQHHVMDLHYRLAPEETTALTGSKFRLVSTEVALTSGGVLDSDTFAFWDDILEKSPAHYQVTKFTIQRLDGDLAAAAAAIRAGHPVPLIKAELDFRWISLRSPPEAVTASATPPAGAGAPIPASATTGAPR